MTEPAPWWQSATAYQIYPRSYLDANGDGVGDLPGIIQHLDHIAALGVDAIWISPFFKSPMADFGYDIADYRDVDPLFGNLDDFDRLLAKAPRYFLPDVAAPAPAAPGGGSTLPPAWPRFEVRAAQHVATSAAAPAAAPAPAAPAAPLPPAGRESPTA